MLISFRVPPITAMSHINHSWSPLINGVSSTIHHWAFPRLTTLSPRFYAMTARTLNYRRRRLRLVTRPVMSCDTLTNGITSSCRTSAPSHSRARRMSFHLTGTDLLFVLAALYCCLHCSKTWIFKKFNQQGFGGFSHLICSNKNVRTRVSTITLLSLLGFEFYFVYCGFLFMKTATCWHINIERKSLKNIVVTIFVQCSRCSLIRTKSRSIS